MSDQKKWFKVWGSILMDPHFANLDVSDVGRWVRLGAYITTCGERGKLTILPPAKTFLLAMNLDTLGDTICALKRLPNVQIEEGKTDNGSFTVIMRNWFKYQVDSTSYERVKRSRHKRRGEEKREEERRGDAISPTLEIFVNTWKQRPEIERRNRAAEIAQELKKFKLSFRIEEEMYAEIMGAKHGLDRSKSITEQVVERRRKSETESSRRKSGLSPARLSDMPDVSSTS